MRKIKTWVALICLAGISPLCAQNADKSLTVEDLVAWQRITEQKIADNGQWVACKMEPWKGDATLYLYDHKGEKVATFETAGTFQFSSSSDYLVVDKSPKLETIEALKLKKTKADNMPMDALVLYTLKGKSETIDSVKTYRMSKEADWLAYQSGRKDSTLYVRSLNGKVVYSFPSVSAYGFASKSGILYFVNKTHKEQKLYVFNPEIGKSSLIKQGRGEFSKMTFDERGNHFAFLYTADKKQAYKNSELWLSVEGNSAQRIATSGNNILPEGWVVSEHSSLGFSKLARRLYFETSPEPRQKDTLQLAENRPSVQVWSWDEPVQYTVQQYNKEKDLKKDYQAVYDLQNGNVCQLATLEQPDVLVGNEGDGAYAITYTSRPYSVSWMWEGRTRKDYDVISLADGMRKSLSKADYGDYRLSPAGEYAYWYAETDSCWYTISLEDGIKHQLTTPQTFIGWDEDNDRPDFPEAYGVAGWSANDESIYIYDRYDIWKFDPQGKERPVNMTVNGRTNQIAYRVVNLDDEAHCLDLYHPLLLKGTNKISKADGYYSLSLKKPASPKVLLLGDFMLGTIDKARHADRLIFTKESYEMYPDVHYTTMKFQKPIQLTEGYKQEQGIVWGTAELVSWTSLDGKKLEGVVYKPANFDPKKKYPMIVNFYERNSDEYFSYRHPQAHRSTIDYRMYNSNGYIIFNPDVRYADGHPGKSCYNCVMPGIQMILDKGYVDAKAIGAQGHSWGGYQVAYLATRTDLFAAIESGAPVVNMFSAYGGIRWGSGLARSFQYEHTQSRLGTTPWNGYEIYKENSPLFDMDKVTTPILILHNDSDGHVPWYQGIEYFVAMKRLGKPCWLLNYPNEPHWPMKLPNKVDFQKRMLQFFNHYLKKEAMPQWMEKGLPAVDEPFELGY